jgi:ketosteroid isomerase-like protein
MLPKYIEIPVRHTYVFQREGDGWKIVHAHISVGVSDESLGM